MSTNKKQNPTRVWNVTIGRDGKLIRRQIYTEKHPSAKCLGDLKREDRTCSKFVKRKSAYVSLLIYNGAGYPIEYDRMNTPEKLLGWIHHLCGKGSVTTDHIEALIDVAKDIGVNIDFHA